MFSWFIIMYRFRTGVYCYHIVILYLVLFMKSFRRCEWYLLIKNIYRIFILSPSFWFWSTLWKSTFRWIHFNITNSIGVTPLHIILHFYLAFQLIFVYKTKLILLFLIPFLYLLFHAISILNIIILFWFDLDRIIAEIIIHITNKIYTLKVFGYLLRWYIFICIQWLSLNRILEIYCSITIKHIHLMDVTNIILNCIY